MQRRLNVKRFPSMEALHEQQALSALGYTIAATFTEEERQHPDYVNRYMQRLAIADKAMKDRFKQMKQLR